MNKRGTVPFLVAFSIPPVVLAGLFAVDATRAWLTHARLQAALDAGALIAARNIDDANRDDKVRAVVLANYNENSQGGAKLAASDVSITMTGADQVNLSAKVGFAPVLNTGKIPALVGGKIFSDNPTVSGGSSAIRATVGTELALVFDITLSMVQSDGTDGTQTRIESARDAAKTMLGILYGDNPDPAKASTNKKWLENLFVSVVPFNVTANYGSANTHFLDGTAVPSVGYVTSWSGTTPSWGGCVEMRSTSLNDATPQGTSGMRRYYWPSTYVATEKYQSVLGSNQPYCVGTAAYKYTGNGTAPSWNNTCMGHNDWTGPAELLTQKQNTLLKAFSTNFYVTSAKLDIWSTGHGPNMMCPPDTHKILPLTRDRATVASRINALTTLPFSYGTNLAAGLQAGWFTLSPNWRAKSGFAGWPSAEPPANSNDPRPTLPALPLNYGTAKWRKVMILLTDGDDLWLSARDVQGNVNTLVRPESKRAEGFYGSYGYLGSDFVGDDRFTATSTATASSNIDTEAEAWCDKIKTKLPAAKAGDPPGAEQVTIFTIGFGADVSDRAEQVLTYCASSQGTKKLYFPAPTAADLKKVFTAIGNILSQLRLSN